MTAIIAEISQVLINDDLTIIYIFVGLHYDNYKYVRKRHHQDTFLFYCKDDVGR